MQTQDMSLASQHNHSTPKTFKNMAKTIVVWKYDDKAEQRKEFPDFISAMRFQGSLLKKKKGLEYAKYA